MHSVRVLNDTEGAAGDVSNSLFGRSIDGVLNDPAKAAAEQGDADDVGEATPGKRSGGADVSTQEVVEEEEAAAAAAEHKAQEGKEGSVAGDGEEKEADGGSSGRSSTGDGDNSPAASGTEVNDDDTTPASSPIRRIDSTRQLPPEAAQAMGMVTTVENLLAVHVQPSAQEAARACYHVASLPLEQLMQELAECGAHADATTVSAVADGAVKALDHCLRVRKVAVTSH